MLSARTVSRACVLSSLLFSLGIKAASAADYFQRWQARASATQARQPGWAVPILAPFPTLIQVFRADFLRQITPTGVHTWNLGNSRGLNLIPYKRTEVDITVPPFFEHGDKTADGFGDFGFTAKYRLASSPTKEANYSAMAILAATFPTGSYKNGSTAPVLTPTISAGKGWGRFDLVSGISSALPANNTATIGRTLATNTYAQCHVGKYFWPELEYNTTTWYGSTRDGKTMGFLTPGLMLSKFAFSPQNPRARSSAAFGLGFQTAVTTYRTYNHQLIFTGRYLF